MKPAGAFAVAAVLVMLTHGAAAEAPFTARSLVVDGAAALDGAALALFALGTQDAPVSWTLTAESAVVERTYMEWREVRDPSGRVLVRKVDDQGIRTERLSFTRVGVRSEGTEPFAALLARGEGVRATLSSADGLSLTPVKDPSFDQGAPYELESDAALPLAEIHETVPGDLLLSRATRAAFRLEGDLRLVLVGPDYALDAAEGAYAGRTGWVEERVLATYAEGRFERQVVTLTGAILHLEAPLDVQLAVSDGRLAFQGAVLAEDPVGAFPLGLPARPGAAWMGQGELDLSVREGRIAAQSPDALRAAGEATVARAPPVAYALGALALLAAAGVALAVVLVRRRAAQEDPLALA
ncbi:MAG TPA: hypothetical protein VNX21_06560, partial [Candidatus Thermoplasmatota archaeon]|nr:hypothetical protein [Candidatus Thermoplasmatota archaeon]